jgi:hypothetical protein
MNYLDQDQGSYILRSASPNGEWMIIFEDNKETGYMYLCKLDATGVIEKIVNHLWVYSKIVPAIEEYEEVDILWSHDSSRTALEIDGNFYGIMDLESNRKIATTIEDNIMIPIPREIWENGIHTEQGQPL